MLFEDLQEIGIMETLNNFRSLHYPDVPIKFRFKLKKSNVSLCFRRRRHLFQFLVASLIILDMEEMILSIWISMLPNIWLQFNPRLTFGSGVDVRK